MNLQKALPGILVALVFSCGPALSARYDIPEPKTQIDSGAFTLYSAGESDYYIGRYDRKKYLDAQACFSAAIDLAPFGPYAGLCRLELAKTYTALGDHSKAEQILKKLLNEKERTTNSEIPSRGEVLTSLGILYSAQKRFELAESNFLAAIKSLNPKDPQLPVTFDNLAVMYDKMGSYAKADPLYKQALALLDSSSNKNYEEVRTNLDNYSLHYLNQKKFAEAEPLLKRATDARPGQIDDEAIFFLEKHAEALRTLGRKAEADNLNVSINTMREKLANFRKRPNQPDPDRQHFIQLVYLQIGTFAIAKEAEEEHYDEALRLASRIIGLLAQTQSEEVSALYLMRTDLHMRTGQYDKAIADCDLADLYIPEQKFQAATSMLRAEAYRYLGQHAKSIDQLTKSITLMPTAISYAMRSADYRQIGENKKADDDEAKALTLGIKCVDMHGFLKAINQFPTDAAGYTKRGDDWCAIGLTDRAMADYRKAIALDPKYANAFTQRGNLFHKLNNDIKASEDYQKASALNPKLNEGRMLKLNEEFAESLTRGYDRKAIESYLSKGADINTASILHGTSIMLAAKNGDWQFVQQLLAKGAKLDVSVPSRQEIFRPAGQDSSYKSPLRVGHEPPRTARMVYKTPLILALEFDPKSPQLNQSKKQIALLLIKHGIKFDKFQYGDPLGTAIQFTQDKQIIEALLDAGAPVNGNSTTLQDTDSMAPIALATIMGNKEIITLLLERGASLDSAPQNGAGRGYTPLCWAVDSKNIDMIKFLLSKGADPMHREHDGITAMNLAGRQIDHKCLEVLRSAGYPFPGDLK